MGYYTRFQLDYYGIADKEQFAKDFESVCEISLETIDLDELKWYDWENNMIDLSLLHPNAIFYLAGVGEDPNDRWKAEIYRGKCHQVYAELIYPAITWHPDDDPRIHSPELFV